MMFMISREQLHAIRASVATISQASEVLKANSLDSEALLFVDIIDRHARETIELLNSLAERERPK